MRRLWRAGGSRIVRGMLGYVVVMAALATLSPFDFQVVPGRRFAVMFLADDVVLNLLFLFPVGFLFALNGGRAREALWLGLGLSAALECAQLFLPSRHANFVDVVTNALGCFGGALAQRRFGLWLASFISKELVLELPLTGALYVQVPLLMLLGLSAGDSARLWLLVPLALFSAVILAALYQQRFAHSGRLPAARFAVYCGLLFAGLCSRAWIERPSAAMLSAGCLVIAIWVAVRLQIGRVPAQRRFEAATVRRGLPWFALYLAGAFAFAWLEPPFGYGGQREAMRLLEWLATFTVYGYLSSELSSRAAMAVSRRLAMIAASGSALAAMIELAHPAVHGVFSTLLRVYVLGAGAAAGAGLHVAQVGLVQAMRASGTSLRPPSGRPAS